MENVSTMYEWINKLDVNYYNDVLIIINIILLGTFSYRLIICQLW